MRLLRRFWICGLLLFLPQILSADEFFLKNGDRVVFYGDSITQDGGYAEMIDYFVATRFPAWDVKFYYAGVGGDRVSGGGAGGIEERLNRDVIALKPTVVTIMLGMNDGGYRSFDSDLFNRYSEGYRHIVARLKQALPGVRLTMIGPSPFDDISRPPEFEGGYDEVLRRYGQFVEDLAHQTGAVFADFGLVVNNGIRQIQKENPALARQIIPDRIHPGAAGHLIMGAALLRAWHAPTLVTRVEIDAIKGAILAAENSTVANLSAEGVNLSWKQTDQTLPLPLYSSTADVELAEKAGVCLEGLDRQILKISGLKAGQYELHIDGEPVGIYPEQQWRDGVDFALHSTPMRGQSLSTLWEAQERKELQTVCRRVLISSAGDPSLLPGVAALQKIQIAPSEGRKGTVPDKVREFKLMWRFEALAK